MKYNNTNKVDDCSIRIVRIHTVVLGNLLLGMLTSTAVANATVKFYLLKSMLQ